MNILFQVIGVILVAPLHRVEHQSQADDLIDQHDGQTLTREVDQEVWLVVDEDEEGEVVEDREEEHDDTVDDEAKDAPLPAPLPLAQHKVLGVLVHQAKSGSDTLAIHGCYLLFEGSFLVFLFPFMVVREAILKYCLT